MRGNRGKRWEEQISDLSPQGHVGTFYYIFYFRDQHGEVQRDMAHSLTIRSLVFPHFQPVEYILCLGPCVPDFGSQFLDRKSRQDDFYTIHSSNSSDQSDQLHDIKPLMLTMNLLPADCKRKKSPSLNSFHVGTRRMRC